MFNRRDVPIASAGGIAAKPRPARSGCAPNAELLAEIAERGERHGERGSRAATKLSDLGVSKGRSRRRGRLSEDQNRSD